MAKKQLKIDKDIILKFRKETYFNSKRLISDAKKLYEIGRFQSATFLAITAIEECGKLHLAAIMTHKNNNNELDNKFVNMLIKHDKKQINSFINALPNPNTGDKVTPNISKFWELGADKKLMTIRNNCLYTGFNSRKNEVYTPEKSINKSDAFYFIQTAYEIIISQLDNAFGHFWLDQSEDIDQRTKQNEKEELIRNWESFPELY